MKALFLSVFVMLLVACSPFGFNPMGYEVKHENLDEAWKKVSAMKYIPELEGKNYWKSPIEFYADGGGDCEDFSVALIYELGPEASAVCYKTEKGKHCIVYYDGSYIEPQNYGEICYIFNIEWILTYSEVMKLCTNFGKKSL